MFHTVLPWFTLGWTFPFLGKIYIQIENRLSLSKTSKYFGRSKSISNQTPSFDHLFQPYEDLSSRFSLLLQNELQQTPRIPPPPPLLSTLPYFFDMKQLPLVVEQRGSKRGKKGNKDSSCIWEIVRKSNQPVIIKKWKRIKLQVHSNQNSIAWGHQPIFSNQTLSFPTSLLSLR